MKRDNVIKASWDDNAAAWTRAVREGRIESRVRSTNAAVVAAVQDAGGSRVLEVGCGEGWLCRAVAELGFVAVGFDGSAALVAEAKQSGGGEYQVLGYEEFAAHPFRAGDSFDTVVCNYSLLGEDVFPVLEAAAAVLKPRGNLIIQTVHPFSAAGAAGPYEDGWRTEDFRGMGEGFKTAMPWYFRTVGSWVTQVRLSGFELLECRETTDSDARPISLLLIAARRV